MNASTRFTTSRGKFGSPLVYDNEGKRPVAVYLRDTEMPQEAADAAAMHMARICAQALNRVHAELVWKKQQEGGK